MPESPPTIGHHIDGKDIFEGDILDRHNPADYDNVAARYHDGTPGIMNAAVDAADRAFEKWADTTPSLRGEVLFYAAMLLNTPEWRARFVQAMVEEIGKTTAGANGEVTKTFNILRYMAGLPTHTRGDVFNADQPKVHMYSGSEPVGVAGLVGPFNFPLAVAVWKAAAALAAGCTVVLKPSPHAPRTSALIAELFEEAMRAFDANNKDILKKSGIGPGVINVVHGGPEVVSALVQHQLVQALSFTGSSKVADSILMQAMMRKPRSLDPAHFVSEGGGDNAIVVLADADLKMAASAAVTATNIGEGQRCTATKRIFVDESVADEFLRLYMEEIRELQVGPGSDPKNDVGPLVTPAAIDDVIRAVEESIACGMHPLLGGRRLQDGILARGNFMEPTLLEGDRLNPGHRAIREEIFGPVAGFQRIRGFEEGLEAVNDNPHRHVAGVFTTNLRLAYEFLRRAKAGMRHVNNSTLGGDVQAPFGGMGGATSYGPQEMGPMAMEPFLKHYTAGVNWSDKVLGGRAR